MVDVEKIKAMIAAQSFCRLLLTQTIVMSFVCMAYSPSSSLKINLSDFPFRNTSLPLNTRVDDLVNRLNVSELVQQMTRGGGGGDGGPVPPISRLGIGTYWWGTECIHGDAYGTSTSFPLSLGLAATFK